MEKNPNLSKEKANFVFNKIQNYYNQSAYQLALDEIQANKELTGSVLNIGSQLKLNKMYSDSVVKLMLDAFEVSGNLDVFSTLFTQNHTLLELHSDRKMFDLLEKYYTEKEGNTNFKSRKVPYNQVVPVDESVYPEEGLFQMSIKTAVPKDPKAADIEKDFFDAIEQPSFQYHTSPPNEDEEEFVIKSNVDTKAIHDDFFDSIRPPTIPAKAAHVDDIFEQLSFEESGVEPESSSPNSTNPQKKKSTKKSKTKSTNSNKDTLLDPNLVYESQNHGAISKKLVVEPIAIEKTILGKKDDAAQALREKIHHLEMQTQDQSAVKEDPRDKNIKQRVEIVENGKKRTETTHKSGGKITEITLDSYEEYANARDQKKPSRKIVPKNSAPAKKESPQKTQPKPNKKQPAKYDNNLKKPANLNETRAKSQKSQKHSSKKLNYPAVLGLLALVVLLIFGVYQIFGNNEESAQTPDPTVQTPGKAQTPTEEQPQEGTETQDPADPTDVTDPDAAETVSSEYLLPSSERLLTDEDFSGMDKAQVRLAINEMFARYGWNFGNSGEIYDYFSQKSWYKPDLSMTSSNQAEQQFTPTERQNLQIILAKFQSM